MMWNHTLKMMVWKEVILEVDLLRVRMFFVLDHALIYEGCFSVCTAWGVSHL